MPSLTTAEHQQAHRVARWHRNAAARIRRRRMAWAQGWCEDMQATVQRVPQALGWLWEVRVPGFHPAWAGELWLAVEQLDANIATFCDDPHATKTPTGTGAALQRVRALRAQHRQAS